jgi:hypothetical protein
MTLPPIAAKPVEQITESELVDALRDPQWRLRNLYWIMDKDGHPVLFQPWPEQQKFYDNIWYRNVIPKARQRGFSTAVQIMMLDACLFVPNTASAVLAQDDTTALQIFQKKIKFAWDRLPALVREGIGTRYDTKHEMVWGNDSSMLVATSTRGTTLQYLHVSEYGQICAKYPDRANEIQEGSLPSVDKNGIIVIESTVETPFGHFSDLVRQAEALQQSGRKLSPLDYRLHFASWWDAPEYEIDPELIPISPKDNAYFHRVEGEIGRDISPRKRAWYVAKRDNDFGGNEEGGLHRFLRGALALQPARPCPPRRPHRPAAAGARHPGQHLLGSPRQQGGVAAPGGRPVGPLRRLHRGLRRALFLRRAPDAGAAGGTRLRVGHALPAA